MKKDTLRRAFFFILAESYERTLILLSGFRGKYEAQARMRLA